MDFHVQRLCQNMYYHLYLLRRLGSILPRERLLQVNNIYIKPRLYYGITLYGCSTQKNIHLVQRVQNHTAKLITANFDYINCRGLDLVNSLYLYTIRDRRNYFLTSLMFIAIHGIAQPITLIALSWILMLMAMTPEDLIWNNTSPCCVKRLLEIVLCKWEAIPLILDSLNCC